MIKSNNYNNEELKDVQSNNEGWLAWDIKTFFERDSIKDQLEELDNLDLDVPV